MPLKVHENVLIFYKSLPIYNPQKTSGHKPVNTYTKHVDNGSNYGDSIIGISGGGNTDRFPRDIIKFKWDTQKSKLHPTQKPVAANEYFIKTYTNEGDVVLDCCMGSGSTGVAALNTDREFIGIEMNEEYFNIAQNRLNQIIKEKG
jgi:DNA modification methylase